MAPGLDSRHSFSYGRHYDPDNLGFGALMAHNEDRLAPGAGYERHAHRGLDIVTWVLSGTLAHEHWPGRERTDDEPAGRRKTLGAGMAQVLRTGSGVDHAEHGAGAADVHYVQMWLASAAPGAAPDYGRRDFTAALTEAQRMEPPGLVPIASGRADPTGATLALTQPGAELSVARLPAGVALALPVAPLVHVFLARGVVSISDGTISDGSISDGTISDGTRLAAGDALRVRDSDAPSLVADETSEILVWTW